MPFKCGTFVLLSLSLTTTWNSQNQRKHKKQKPITVAIFFSELSHSVFRGRVVQHSSNALNGSVAFSANALSITERLFARVIV